MPTIEINPKYPRTTTSGGGLMIIWNKNVWTGDPDCVYRVVDDGDDPAEEGASE